MLETTLFSPGKIVHDPFRPFITPIHPSLVLDFTLQQRSTQHVEGGHGIDVFGSTFTLGNGVLGFEPAESGSE